MRFASTSPRRAAGKPYLKISPARPEPGSLGHFFHLLRDTPLNEVMSGVMFMAVMAVGFLAMVAFS